MRHAPVAGMLADEAEQPVKPDYVAGVVEELAGLVAIVKTDGRRF